MTEVPLRDLAESWMLALEAEGKSPATLYAYRWSLTSFFRWYEAQGGAEPVLDKPGVQAFITDLRRAGQRPGTLRLRQAALHRFARWLRDEGERDYDVLDGLRLPKLDDPVVPHLTDAQMAALLKACKGTAFLDRRDEAIVRLMTEGMLRSAELLALTVADVDLRAGLAHVVRGKGGKGRWVPFGPETGTALDRYRRVRSRQPLAVHTAALWLPGNGSLKPFSYPGLSNAIKVRATRAGIDGFHLHRLRHTGAVRWRRAGGSEEGLRSAGGWTRNSDMITRYTASASAELAQEEARRLRLGRF
ncbi:MAG: tyrosine-type recombinase/integrase [Gemmatimonadota bacterium]